MKHGVYLAVGCQYFPPDPGLPSQPESITTIWPILSCTA